MSRQSTQVVILAAGQGTRMKSALPKVLHELCGRPMLAWVLDQARSLDPERIVLVLGHGADAIRAELEKRGEMEGVSIVIQEPQNGTGHALQCCAQELGEDPGRVVVLYGDMPLLREESLEELCIAADETGPGGMALLTAMLDDPRGFGRIVRDQEGIGRLTSIVEQRDCNAQQLEIREGNLGVYAFSGKELMEALPKLASNNAQGEYYLTDVVGMFVEAGRLVATVVLEDVEETIGVNNLEQLSEARWGLQARILEQHLANGVHIDDPSSAYIDHGVEIGCGTRVLPCTVIRSGVVIGEGCEVGPFTHLRAGTVLENGAEVGNFTECKNSTVGAGSKAKHLSYLGDAKIGAKTNIGAGTIFANYDGTHKHITKVGDGAFIGSGTIIVAPNEIADGATTGAGAVVTRGAKVGKDQVWVGIPARELGGSKGSDLSGAKK